MSDEITQAVGVPLERQVRPRAWARVCNISDTTRGVFEPGAQGEAPNVELKTERLVPLYDQAAIDAAVAAERQATWDAVNRLIMPGDLGGNGCDNNAQRNGIILAANVLMERIAGPNV